LRDVVDISAGEDHSLALLDTGAVVGWGTNLQGEISIPRGLTNIVAIAAGRGYSVALRGNGSLASWGSGSAIHRVRDFPHNTTSVVAIGAANVNTIIGYRDGRIMAYGTANFGALASRTLTRTSMPTLTASNTLIPTNSLTPSNTKTMTPTITLTHSRTPTRTR
jgi:alpha-tubulin suppressor-like RCC1 family protein